MAVFGSNVLTASAPGPSPPSDSGTPGIGRGAASPGGIHTTAFLGGGLQAAVDQALLHGNGSIAVPALNEDVTGNSNISITRDRVERVKGTTNSQIKGGLLGSFGKNTAPSGQPFGAFIYSAVYEGPVRSYQYARQDETSFGQSSSVEFGNRVITRSNYEQRTVYGTLATYVYGDVLSLFAGLTNYQKVLGGTRQDRYSAVMSMEFVMGINFLAGTGLHLQCRPGAELNFNVRGVVIALSETLVGLMNLDTVVNRISGKPVNFGLSGARISADIANVRAAAVPAGPMRIP